jgi:hypothetical protein
MNRMMRSGNAPSAAKAFDEFLRQAKRAEALGMNMTEFLEEYQPSSSAPAGAVYEAAFAARSAVDWYEREVKQ